MEPSVASFLTVIFMAGGVLVAIAILAPSHYWMQKHAPKMDSWKRYVWGVIGIGAGLAAWALPVDILRLPVRAMDSLLEFGLIALFAGGMIVFIYLYEGAEAGKGEREQRQAMERDRRVNLDG